MAAHDEIRGFIMKELLLDAGASGIEDDTPLLEESLIDSLGVCRLATWMEESYGIRIGDTEMVPEHFGSIEAMARFVERKRDEKNAG